MLVVHRHIHDQDPIDLTDWVTALDVTLSTTDPWSAIDASLRLPFTHRGVAPEPGDYLTVQRDDTGRAVAWGNVTSAPEPGLVREGKRLTGGTVRTRAWSWMNLLREAQVYAHGSPGRLTGVGTLFTLEEWNRRGVEIMNIVNGKHGEQLVKLLRLFGRLELPTSLGGGMLGDSIAVAHDANTAGRLGLHASIDRVLGPRLAGDQAWPGATNALSMLLSLFQPNRDLIECFEVLCPLSDGVRRQLQTEVALAEGLARAASSSAEPFRDALEGLALTAADSAIVTNGALINKLRAVPTLVYRLFPGRVESFESYLSGQRSLGTPAMIAGYERALTLARELFPGTTWPAPEVVISADECPNFDPPMRTNGGRINAVTIDPGLGEEALKFWEEAGLPLLDEQDIRRFGLRLLDIRWPYFAPDDADFVAWLRLIAGLGSQLFLRRERFYRGTVKVMLRLDMQPGRVFQLELPNGRKFTAYAEMVRHSIARDGPVLAGWTHITYSRGLYDNVPRAIRPTAARTRPSTAVSTEPGTEVERPAKKPTEVVSSSIAGSWGTAPSPSPAPPTPRPPARPQPTTDAGVLYRGAAIAWPYATRLERRLSRTESADRTLRPLPERIDILTLHYTDGRSTDVSAPIRTLASKGGDGAHFILQPDGILFQYMDLEKTAIHVGQNDMNRRSVGVEIMCPGARQLVDDSLALPWPSDSGFYYNTHFGLRARKIYHATPAQETALVDLIRFLSTNFSVPLRAPAADTEDPKRLRVPKLGHRCDETIADGGTGIALAPGIWHHVELYNPPQGRADALGVIIPNLISRVAG